MKNVRMIAIALAVVIFALLGCAVAGLAAGDEPAAAPAPAAEAPVSPEVESIRAESSLKSVKAIAAGAAVGLVAAVGAIGMALVISRTTDNMARQPEASSQINGAMMLGLVFIETVILYALIVAILIIFVL